MACGDPIATAVLENGVLDVADKFRQTSEAILGSESIYMRAKDTFKELFDNKKISETDYANFAGQFITNLAATATQQAMQVALQWAKEEKELQYSLANVKANIELVHAQTELAKANICSTEADTAYKKAQITAILAASIRDNGRVATYAADGYTPLTLQAEGTKYGQQLAVAAQKYSTLADSYRKSGVVTIGTTLDGETKAVSGDAAGYTEAQERFVERQILSFEDSKRNHAANAISTLIGQLLASEIAPSTDYVTQWNSALNYLNTNTPTV